MLEEIATALKQRFCKHRHTETQTAIFKKRTVQTTVCLDCCCVWVKQDRVVFCMEDDEILKRYEQNIKEAKKELEEAHNEKERYNI